MRETCLLGYGVANRKENQKKKSELYQLRCVTTSEKMDRSGLQKEKRPTVDEEQVTGKKKAVAKLYQKVFGRIGSIEKMI